MNAKWVAGRASLYQHLFFGSFHLGCVRRTCNVTLGSQAAGWIGNGGGGVSVVRLCKSALFGIKSCRASQSDV